MKKLRFLIKYLFGLLFYFNDIGHFILNIEIKRAKAFETVFKSNLQIAFKYSKCFNFYIQNVLTSSFLTIFSYLTCHCLISIFINFNLLSDPSQEIQILYSTDHSVELNDFKILKDLMLKNLPESRGKYFLCYRSLLYLLKFNLNNYDKNFLDLCFYDPKTTTHHALSNIHYLLGYSQLNFFLSNLTQQNGDLSYEFNLFYGFYKISYRSASIFLFLFIKASATNLEFESINRFGILYTQFNQIVKSHFLPMQDLDARPKVSFLNSIPSYMVDEMIYKVNITHDFVYLPIDPFNMLMYFYPNNWHFPLDDQKFKYLNKIS